VESESRKLIAKTLSTLNFELSTKNENSPRKHARAVHMQAMETTSLASAGY
jgi:hypothetical protein